MLEKLRSGEPLTAKEKLIHDQGVVTVLRQIHDELDEAVLEANGGDLAGHDLGTSQDVGWQVCTVSALVARNGSRKRTTR